MRPYRIFYIWTAVLMLMIRIWKSRQWFNYTDFYYVLRIIEYSWLGIINCEYICPIVCLVYLTVAASWYVGSNKLVFRIFWSLSKRTYAFGMSSFRCSSSILSLVLVKRDIEKKNIFDEM